MDKRDSWDYRSCNYLTYQNFFALIERLDVHGEHGRTSATRRSRVIT